MAGVGGEGVDVTCDFTKSSFDLKIHGLGGKNYRLVKDNLDKDIVPEKSKVRVKKDSVKILLRKAKGEYGPEQWVDLVAKGGAAGKKRKTDMKKDPTAGIMDMMRDMYDSGDDQMKKTIGEAMLKSRQGGGSEPDGMGGMGGMGGGMGGF